MQAPKPTSSAAQQQQVRLELDDQRSTPPRPSTSGLRASPADTPGSSASQRDTPGRLSGNTSILALQANSSNATDVAPPSPPARHRSPAAGALAGVSPSPPPPDFPSQPGSNRRHASTASLPSSSYEYSAREVQGSSAYGSERSSAHSHLKGALLGSMVSLRSVTCLCFTWMRNPTYSHAVHAPTNICSS
jgi:hypothetical protein